LLALTTSFQRNVLWVETIFILTNVASQHLVLRQPGDKSDMLASIAFVFTILAGEMRMNYIEIEIFFITNIN
jgi:hypothetical protein